MRSLSTDYNFNLSPSTNYNLQSPHPSPSPICLETHREMDSIIGDTNDRSIKVKDALKEMDGENKRLVKDQPTASDTRIHITQHTILTKKFVDVMNEYQGVQVKFKNKFKQKLQRQFLIVKPDASTEEVEKIVDSKNTNIFSQQASTFINVFIGLGGL